MLKSHRCVRMGCFFLAPRVSASHPMSPCLYSDSEDENIDVKPDDLEWGPLCETVDRSMVTYGELMFFPHQGPKYLDVRPIYHVVDNPYIYICIYIVCVYIYLYIYTYYITHYLYTFF